MKEHSIGRCHLVFMLAIMRAQFQKHLKSETVANSFMSSADGRLYYDNDDMCLKVSR